MDGSDRRSAATAWQVARLGLALFLGIVVAVVWVARNYTTNPDVGDIVALQSGAALPDVFRERLAAVRLNNGSKGAACALDTEVMAKAGGSLVVEAKREGTTPLYTVHWAGGPTSHTAQDCGRSADLELTSSEIAHLAQISGDHARIRRIQGEASMSQGSALSRAGSPPIGAGLASAA